jgi:AbrB family looped-hinge helix DNA binding protein
MMTKVSSKGQVILPGPIRRKLGIRAGDPLEASVEAGRIVLTPRKKTPRNKARIVYDPATGLPALDAGPDAPVLTHEEVKAMLADFP